MYHNGEKQVLNSSEREYQATLKAALAQSDAQANNAYVNGLQKGAQEVYQKGAFESVKASRTHYGAPTETVNQAGEGEYSNFQQRDTPGNVANASAMEMMNTTGNADAQTSATRSANKDPEEFQTDALDKRLAVIGGALGTTANNLNNHRQVYQA